MSLVDQKQLRQNAVDRRRGLIVNFLYVSRPKPLEFASLIYLLDKHNNPVSPHRLAEDLDTLRGLKLLRVFPIGSNDILDDVGQVKLIERYCESDGELDDEYAARLTSRGINFQEGHFEEPGVTRVN